MTYDYTLVYTSRTLIHTHETYYANTFCVVKNNNSRKSGFDISIFLRFDGPRNAHHHHSRRRRR